MRKVVGISCDVIHKPRELGGRIIDQGRPARRLTLPADYVQAVHDAGGTAILLPHDVARLDDYLALCDAFVLAGGDDPDTTAFGQPVHPDCVLIDPDRQQFELALLNRLDQTAHGLLGICLGMQLMALHHGGRLHQSINTDLDPQIAQAHADADHTIKSAPGYGLPPRAIVHSSHRQAVAEAGSMTIAATSDDGLIEAIALPAGRFYLGVQWHPERTRESSVGIELFKRLIASA